MEEYDVVVESSYMFGRYLLVVAGDIVERVDVIDFPESGLAGVYRIEELLFGSVGSSFTTLKRALVSFIRSCRCEQYDGCHLCTLTIGIESRDDPMGFFA